MKSLKQWLLALMAVFMVAGFATGCTNEDTETDDTTNTEENQDAESTETEESGQ